ncbi:type II toxin-antitoxin system RelE/ParE family toxin [Rhodopila sp.]|uniref:type II toxin-antitoxin system RelE/ParE family toxin n=1 Tax=Rhodopila sp. TaxID=2480087 RepID=UPI003D125EF8
MPFRLVGVADDQIDKILQGSEANWGLEGAYRYGRLILAAMTAIGESPALPGSRPVTLVRGVRSLHHYSARRFVAPEHRVGQPRHLVLYRIAPEGAVEILGVVHYRQQLPRAARRAQREAGG